MDEYAQTRHGYDSVAEEYAAHLYHELEHKPFDRALLARFAEHVGTSGPICDVGCGPGHIARYLRAQGANVLGIDLAPGMIEIARKLSPDIEFHVGNMMALPIADESWEGVVAFYSIVHIEPERIDAVLREFWRVLSPHGALLLSFHVGDEVRHLEEFFDQPVSLDFVFFRRTWIELRLLAAGFEIVESTEREPYRGFEVETRRAYVWARKEVKR
jgi:ubiquinone/menaquinone biosynthesis C-methylase UbiE